MGTAANSLYQFKATNSLINVLGAILTALAFIVLVETSYFRWHSNFLVLAKFFMMALICNSGLFFSATRFGRRHKIVSVFPILIGLVSVPLLVGYFHTIVAIGAMLVMLLALVEVFRKNK